LNAAEQELFLELGPHNTPPPQPVSYLDTQGLAEED
jgi:hypothetical protein